MATSDLTGHNGHGSNGAAAQEGSGPHATAKKNPPSAISGQLRDELIRILQAGDEKHDGAFTVAVVTRVEKFAVAAREILMTENLAQNDLAALMMMRKRQHPGIGMYQQAGWSSLVGGDSGLVEAGMPLTYPNNENFGVQAIRQLVDAAKAIGDSPAKLVEALAVARSSNLPDVAAALEKKLGVLQPEDVALEGSDS